MMAEQAKEPDLFALVYEAVKDGVKAIQSLSQIEQKYLSEVRDWRRVSYGASGMPSLSPVFQGPKNYSEAFGRTDQAKIRSDRILSFERVFEAFKAHERLRSYYSWPYPNDRQRAFMERFVIDDLLTSSVDRYIHIYGLSEVEREKLLPIYLPLEVRSLNAVLPYDLVVPILFLRFDFDTKDMGGGVSIERMDDAFQLARAGKVAYGPGVHESVVSAATHALIIKKQSVQNESWWKSAQIWSEVSNLQRCEVDLFFASIRIARLWQTGYAQLLGRPLGWTASYTEKLPYVFGTSVRGYPYRFENFYWLNEELPIVTEAVAEEIGEIFRQLRKAQDNRIPLAVRRFSGCFIRDDAEDVVLDATIGLESLLSDASKEEITHKLALRLAVLARETGFAGLSVADVFTAAKKVYAYRSMIVHGSTKAAKGVALELGGEKRNPDNVALILLQMTLRALLRRPEFLDARKLDDEVLASIERGALGTISDGG